MDRLTKHWDNNYVPTKLNWDFVFDLDDETFKNLEDIVIRLAKYEDTGFEPEEIEKLNKSCSLDVGQEVYVLTRYYSSSPYEIIKCRINRKTVKTRQTFSVSGEYSNGNFYNGTFVEKSIGKTVFILEEDAIKMRDKLNKKRF